MSPHFWLVWPDLVSNMKLGFNVKPDFPSQSQRISIIWAYPRLQCLLLIPCSKCEVCYLLGWLFGCDCCLIIPDITACFWDMFCFGCCLCSGASGFLSWGMGFLFSILSLLNEGKNLCCSLCSHLTPC